MGTFLKQVICCSPAMARLTALLALAALAVTSRAFLLTDGPAHASCHIDWVFGKTCTQVHDWLVNQINAWDNENCGSGPTLNEKCRYKLTSETATEIKAKHVTPVKEYTDDLTFKLTPDGANCKVHGFSTSETWYAVLDYGTNYCNLHNLVIGAGLDQGDAMFTETAEPARCTQVASANCTRY